MDNNEEEKARNEWYEELFKDSGPIIKRQLECKEHEYGQMEVSGLGAPIAGCIKCGFVNTDVMGLEGRNKKQAAASSDTSTDIKKSEQNAFRKAIGAKLKEVRELKGLSLKEVGQRVGLATHTVNSIEEGKWPFNIDVLHSLTKALDFDIVFEV